MRVPPAILAVLATITTAAAYMARGKIELGDLLSKRGVIRGIPNIQKPSFYDIAERMVFISPLCAMEIYRV